MRAAVAVTLLAAAAAAGCAQQHTPPHVQQAAAEGRTCFHEKTISGFRTVRREAIDLTVSRDEVYRAELFGFCPGVDEAVALGVTSRGSSWICEGGQVEITVPVRAGPRQCPVRSIRRLTQPEIDAERAARR